MFACSFNTGPHRDLVPVNVQRKQPTVRAGAEWDRPPSPRVTERLPEPGPESETTLSPSPAHSLDTELDIPMETDIDDFQEGSGPRAEDEPINSELPCFALPVTVLETDIDTLEDNETVPAAESGSLEEEPEGRESAGARLSLEELFPHSNDGEPGPESWRELEHNTDSLDR